MHNQIDSMDQEETKGIKFDLPKNRSNVIKVLGVGGGGSNAINYMFLQGIKGVDFIVSNTDAQALAESGVTTKIQLGASLTEGLGAGANPEVGERAAIESKDEIQSILSTQTKMIFITAGMGGGTGTGAAPVIAKMAKSLDILTIGIVTMPFQFEGKLRLEQAQKGLEKIKESVDALIVINNNKLREVYGNLGFKAGFAKADEVLATAARGIAEVITHHYTQNIDLKDAKTVLTNSGTAIMGSGSASGSNRAQEAIVKALDSPLLNDNKITGCKNVLLLIVSGVDEITIDEIGEINDYIQTEAGNHTNIIMGVGEDETLGNEISVTVIATGFGQEQQNDISNTEAKKIIYTLEDDQKMQHNLSEEKFFESSLEHSIKEKDSNNSSSMKSFETYSKSNDNEPLIDLNAILFDVEVDYEIVSNGLPEKKVHTLNEELAPPIIFSAPEPLFSNEIKESALESENEIKKEISPKDELEISDFEFIKKEEEKDPINLSMESETERDEINIGNSFFESQHELVSEGLKPETTDENEVFNSEDSTVKNLEINEVSSILSDIDVIDPEIIDKESQFQMDFKLPFDKGSLNESIGSKLDKKEEEEAFQNIQHELSDSALEVKFEVKEESEKVIEETTVINSESNPFEQTIETTIVAQSEKRREHLKAFNHKFKHQPKRIDEMEKEPAYIRQGTSLDLEAPFNPSRVSLDDDGNEDLQLRSNNSFLHDNVD